MTKRFALLVGIFFAFQLLFLLLADFPVATAETETQALAIDVNTNVAEVSGLNWVDIVTWFTKVLRRFLELAVRWHVVGGGRPELGRPSARLVRPSFRNDVGCRRPELGGFLCRPGSSICSVDRRPAFLKNSPRPGPPLLIRRFSPGIASRA
ncbi:MAG: hypothetical protein M5R36_00820 [Deltaproteobacteria bacterium]|nr:hypothetical protein [Deltaproteobacteria bacterium]